jgi:hypothetical protein
VTSEVHAAGAPDPASAARTDERFLRGVPTVRLTAASIASAVAGEHEDA